MKIRFCKGCGASGYEHYPTIKTYCKPCWRKQVTANRASKEGYYRAYDRARASEPQRRANAARVIERWKLQFPKRRAAQVAVGNAVRDGRLAQWPCLICGAKAEAHHADYDNPLGVTWLCSVHHKAAHAATRKAA